MKNANGFRLEAVGIIFMRIYNVPPNMNEKEKVIGGILNINQFFWVLGGLVLGATVFAITFSIVGGTFALFLGFLCCFSGLPFALYKKRDLSLYEYLYRKRLFKKKVKKLPNKRKEVNL